MKRNLDRLRRPRIRIDSPKRDLSVKIFAADDLIVVRTAKLNLN